MGIPEEKLASVDRALAELGLSDEEISDVRRRFAAADGVTLDAVDGELESLWDDRTAESAPVDVHTAETRAPDAVDIAPEDAWDDESTEVEMVDESDFVLLVDEDDLEELEKVGEDDGMRTAPPAIPNGGEGEEDDGFFKKLFGGRRSRPPQP